MIKAFHAYGTYNKIDIRDGISESKMNEIIEKAFRLYRMLSAFLPESEVSLINKNAGIKETHISPETCSLLQKAIKYSELTGGAFDITIRPAVKLWNFGYQTKKIPSRDELVKIKELVNYKKLHINMDTSTVFLEEPGQEIDLGGIAKGYAADMIRNDLLKNGVRNGMMNFGGTILTIGENSWNRPWRVGIQNPIRERGCRIGSIQPGEAAMVTSAVNERFFIKDNNLYHHLLDPDTLKPSQSGVYSVTAIGKEAADLDALTTGLFVMGMEKGIELAKKEGICVIYLKSDGEIYASEALLKMNFIKERGNHDVEKN